MTHLTHLTDDLIDITAATGDAAADTLSDGDNLTTEEWQALYGETAEEWQAAKAADEAREDARLARERELEAEWEAWQAAHPEYDPTDDEPI